MATYPIQFTSKAPAQEALRIERRQAVMESPHTFAQQTVDNSDRWTLEFSWPRMSLPDAERVQAWLDSLKAQVGSFKYRPRNAVNSTLTGRSLALDAYAYGEMVSIGGWAAGSASSLQPGQYLQIGTRLHRIVSAPAVADGNGRCSVEIMPMIRTSVPAGTAVEFANPVGTFKLATSEGYAYTLDPDRNPSFPAIMAKEAL